MGFDSTILYAHVFGLIVPVLILAFFATSKKRKQIAFDSIFYGIAAFIGGIVSAVVLFVVANMLVLSGISFDGDNGENGLALAAVVISVLVITIYAVCETIKLYVIKKSHDSEDRPLFSGLGFSAGVIIAQNIAAFVALNIINSDELESGIPIFVGAFICFSGVMYTVLSHACDKINEYGNKAPAYALSFIYYLFWIAAVVCSNSTILLYVVLITIFVIAFVLSGVFVFRQSKSGKA